MIIEAAAVAVSYRPDQENHHSVGNVRGNVVLGGVSIEAAAVAIVVSEQRQGGGIGSSITVVAVAS